MRTQFDRKLLFFKGKSEMSRLGRKVSTSRHFVATNHPDKSTRQSLLRGQNVGEKTGLSNLDFTTSNKSA
jgi:hypothetical protein